MPVADTTGPGIGLFVFFFILIVVISIGSLVFFIIALVDIAKRPDWQWKMAGQEKILWLLLVILINFLAIPSLIYWFSIRKQLQAVEEAAAKGLYGPGHMTYGGWEPAPVPATAPAGWYARHQRPGCLPLVGRSPVDGAHVDGEPAHPVDLRPLRLPGPRPRPPRGRDSSTWSAARPPRAPRRAPSPPHADGRTPREPSSARPGGDHGWGAGTARW